MEETDEEFYRPQWQTICDNFEAMPEVETGIELGARAGGESGATCCQRIAPFGATSNTFSLDSHVMVWPLP